MFIVLKIIYSQNDETGLLEVVGMKFFYMLNHGRQAFFFKFFLWILPFGGGITWSFLKIIKLKYL